MSRPRFKPGPNMAMKVPPHEYDRTVAFYRDILGLEVLGNTGSDTAASIRFSFGDKVLWIDRVPGLSQAEIWLELLTDDIAAAADHLAHHGCMRRDEIEPLPDGFAGFWLANPANIIHLVTTLDEA